MPAQRMTNTNTMNASKTNYQHDEPPARGMPARQMPTWQHQHEHQHNDASMTNTNKMNTGKTDASMMNANKTNTSTTTPARQMPTRQTPAQWCQHNECQHNERQHNKCQHNKCQHNEHQHNECQHNECQHNECQQDRCQHNHSMEERIVHATLLIDYLWDSPYIQKVSHRGLLFLWACELNVVEYSDIFRILVYSEFITVLLLYSTTFNSQAHRNSKPYGILFGYKDYPTNNQWVKWHELCVLPCCEWMPARWMPAPGQHDEWTPHQQWQRAVSESTMATTWPGANMRPALKEFFYHNGWGHALHDLGLFFVLFFFIVENR
jgi:hypothetical protein